MNSNLFYSDHSSVVEVIDVEREVAFWTNHYRQYVPGFRPNDYLPALKLGLSIYLRGQGQAFEEAEDDLQQCYMRVRGDSRLDWYEALPVVRAAWARLAEEERVRDRDRGQMQGDSTPMSGGMKVETFGE